MTNVEAHSTIGNRSLDVMFFEYEEHGLDQIDSS